MVKGLRCLVSALVLTKDQESNSEGPPSICCMHRSPPQSRQRETGVTSLDGVVESRRPEYVPGLEGYGANILEDALNTKTVPSYEGPGNTTCINQAQELKEMPL